MKQYKWSGLLVFIAILFVCATIFYSTYVASKIANTEKNMYANGYKRNKPF